MFKLFLMIFMSILHFRNANDQNNMENNIYNRPEGDINNDGDFR